MKEICKNCEHYHPSYKGGVCDKDGRERRVKTKGTCENWGEKR